MNPPRGHTRDRLIGLAIATSGLSKAITILAQLIAIPVAFNALGAERFGAFVMVTALLSWISLSSAGLFPGLTRAISQTERSNTHRLSALFRTTLALATCLAFVAGAVATLLVYTVPPSSLLGSSFAAHQSEIRDAAYTAIGLLVLQVIAGVAEATRAGFQEQHVTNTWGAAGNALSVVALIYVSLYVPTIVAVVLSVHGAIAIGKIGNLLHLICRKSQLLLCPAPTASPPVLKELAFAGSAFMLVQIASLISLQGTAFIVGYFSGPHSVATFSVLQRMVILFGGVVVMVMQPLWPALTNAIRDGEMVWVRSRIKTALLGLSTYALAIAITLGVFGDVVIRYWIGTEISPSPSLFVVTGCYFFLVAWNHVNYTLLVALGQTWLPAIVLSGEAMLALIASLLLVPRLGAEGGMLALAAAAALVTGWIAPLRIVRALSHIGAKL